MAKKQFVKIETAFNADIEAIDDNRCILSLWGVNSAGTEVKVTMSMPDYFNKYLAAAIVKVVKKRVETAKTFKSEMLDALTPINNI